MILWPLVNFHLKVAQILDLPSEIQRFEASDLPYLSEICIVCETCTSQGHPVYDSAYVEVSQLTNTVIYLKSCCYTSYG